MENAAKALEIAAGVILGVLIISLIAYFLTNIGSWPEQEDSQQMIEQTAKFNLEYEVYDKKGMYGTDVISCMSKAINNNEKYYEGGSFLSGQRYGETYWVNVCLLLDSDLEEELIVYHMNSSSDGIYNQVLQYGSECESFKLGQIGMVFDETDNGKKYTKFNSDSVLKNQSNTLTGDGFININDIKTEGELKYNASLYSKTGGKVNTNAAPTPLQILVSTCSSNMRQIVMNRSDVKEDLEAWSSAEWRTALYDFKTRKFKCTEIKYSDVTGRVNEIYFEEI